MLSNSDMKTIDEIRRDNLNTLITEAQGEFALAERYGCTEANIKTMARAYKDSKSGTPKGIGTVAARKLEKVMGKERGWLDHDHSQKDQATGDLPAKETRTNDDYPRSVIALPTETWITELLALARAINDDGRRELIGMAKLLASQKPRVQANRSS